MNIHWIQHVPFEGLGCIAPWLFQSGYTPTCTRLWANETFPSIHSVDGLIVMGGPMGVYDEDQFSWLATEKAFINEMIGQNKPVLGICLGAQLIAAVLSASVRKNSQKEIGFFPLQGDGVVFPAEFTAFHWHGDTFDIPAGAVRLASSAATENQAFIYKNNVLGLQFHLETTEESLHSLYSNCSSEITNAPFIQTLEQATTARLTNGDRLVSANALMLNCLNSLFKK